MGTISYVSLEDSGFYSDQSLLPKSQDYLSDSRSNSKEDKEELLSQRSFSDILQYVLQKLNDGNGLKKRPRSEVLKRTRRVSLSEKRIKSVEHRQVFADESAPVKAPLRRGSLAKRIFKDFRKSFNNKESEETTHRHGEATLYSQEGSSNISTESLEERVGQLLNRQTRSLERNHRHLVNLDSTCRYSREVGSSQVNVDLSPREAQHLGRSSSSIDFNLRYQPDPTVVKKSSDIQSSTKRMSLRNSSNIVSKPARGWLHPDVLFAQDGINYAVQYIGCLRVNTSMKVLDFETRSAIAKECISRVCEAAGRKISDKKRKVDRSISRMLDEVPNMERTGSNLQLTVTCLWLKLSDYDTGKAVLKHIMPNISFASGGDADTSNYVAYVAKDRTHGGTRSCYVIECSGGLAQEVITTIGQAFELRFKEYLKRTPHLHQQQIQHTTTPKPPPQQQESTKSDDVEYYNDLPGKKPPVEPRGEPSTASNNLIDLNTEIAPCHKSEPEYINGDVIFANREEARARDPFDMSPFPSTSLPSPVIPQPPTCRKSDLHSEVWYHGPISRKNSEALLLKDGDFLVRESLGSPGQYVLTGMQNNSKKHLLLVDPEGVVRTKDRSFDSVSHLVNYHLDNGLPIISAESTLRLLSPIPRP